jgi:perosamine synthetase
LEIKYRYYPIKDDLTSNWTELSNLVDKKTKAILMVHYFGQPQDIKRFQNFCKEHNLLLIEDNAHGHGGKYNDHLLGTFGDMGISSPRKILNTHSGGSLWLKDKKFNPPVDFYPYPTSIRNRIKRNVFNYFPSLKNSFKKVLINRQVYEDPTAFRETPISDYTIDKSSKNTIEETNFGKLRRSRQSAYNKWQAFTIENSLTPVYSNLHPEAIPWCFPAYVQNEKDTIMWFDWGWENNEHVFSWPSLPEDLLFNNSESYTRWKKLICFGIR